MNPPNREKAPSTKVKESALKTFLIKLKKRHIFETFVAFIGGGWLILEFVDRLLVAHYHFPDKTIDITFVTILSALVCAILWRWFSGAEKRPGNVKVEVLLVPLVILLAVAIDLNLILQMAGVQGKTLLIGIVAFLLGIAWVIFKLSQWAARRPEVEKKEVEASPPTLARPEKSIVVLPFADLSPQKDQEYFCDGMTEEIITDLSYLRQLRVISRSSAMTLKAKRKPISEVAKELDVQYVLEGSVRKAGNDLRITAQLVDARKDADIWADRFSGTLDDVFAMQERISRSIVDALKLKLSPEQGRKIDTRSIPNFKAYEYYLKAQHEIWTLTEGGLKRALVYLENGLDIIGKNALLYAGMAYVYWQYVNLGIKGIDQDEHICRAELYVNKALDENPECAQAHLVLGLVNLLFRGNLQDSVRQFKRTLEHDPNALDALLILVLAYWEAGRTSAALPLIEKCIAIDPFNPACYLHQSGVRFFDGRFGLALDSSSQAFKMAPEAPFYSYWHALMLAYNERCDEAISLIDHAARAESRDVQSELSLFLKSALKGEEHEIVPLLTKDFVSNVRRDLQASYNLATFYARLGQNEKALDWLENAVDRGFINYPFLNDHDPWLANIRGKPSFQKLMERVKYEWEHFEV
jgi:eukaryotic-like serine/threonine-protein kinase